MLKRVIEGQRQSVFMAERAVLPADNGAERGSCSGGEFRTITDGLVSCAGAHLHPDVSAVLETACRRAIGALDVIRAPLSRGVRDIPAMLSVPPH